jgi:riboflavin kinase/FMN adenylyltransferase
LIDIYFAVNNIFLNDFWVLYQIKFLTLILKGIYIKNQITSIAIGGFDGMHMAHQQLFSKLDKNGAIVVISTQYANLSPDTHRVKHTSYPLFYYPLENIKHLSGEEFIQLLHEEFPSLKKIVVGYDFHFGYKAKSNIDNLKEIFKGEVVVVDEYKVLNIAVHSRVIREYLREGNLLVAKELLGYSYSLQGNHIVGQGLGEKQFVPTINIDVKDFLIPQAGIYVTKTILHNISYESVSFIGHRVSTDGRFAVETHILEDISSLEIPKKIEMVFFKKLRDNKKYEEYEELKKQILEDIEQTKSWFKSERKN